MVRHHGLQVGTKRLSRQPLLLKLFNFSFTKMVTKNFQRAISIMSCKIQTDQNFRVLLNELSWKKPTKNLDNFNFFVFLSNFSRFILRCTADQIKISACYRSKWIEILIFNVFVQDLSLILWKAKEPLTVVLVMTSTTYCYKNLVCLGSQSVDKNCQLAQPFLK